MKRNRKVKIVLIALFMLTILTTSAVFANSAEPPSLVVLVNNPPQDLEVELIEGGDHRATTRKVAWEGQYLFYHVNLSNIDTYTFRVTSKSHNFTCTYDKRLIGYNEVLTLDLSKQELTYGEYPLRRAILVTLRVVLTLLIEGLVFFAFGFREKSSWIAFVVINLLTQGGLNIWLQQGATIVPGYLIFGLVFGELFVFMAEMIAFPIAIAEKSKRRAVLYAFTANTVSLIAGGYLISMLPV